MIKIITSCQKKPCFVFRRTLRVFHFLVFSFLFPFYFFSFSFLFVFVPSDVSLMFVPLQRVRRMWESVFLLYTTSWHLAEPVFIKAYLGPTVQPCQFQDFPLKFETQTWNICLNHIVFGKRYCLVGSIYVIEVATNYYINPLSLVLNSLY